MSDKIQQSKEKEQSISKEVDIWMLRDNLKLSYEERVSQHQKTLNCIDELKKLRRAHHARTTQVSNQESD